MMRSFLTRLVNSVTRVVLLAPGLLICLACATPFPIENFQEGMTTEMVREKFGEPESIGVMSGDARSRWCYLTEEQNWLMTFFPLSPLLTLAQLPFAAVLPNVRWDDVYVLKEEVVLHFEGEKLVWWGVMDTFGFMTVDPPGNQSRWVRWGDPCDWPQTGGD